MKTLIIYNCYVEDDNCKFFIKNGLIENEEYDYYFIINNPELKLDINKKNVYQINRENIGRDFGAYEFFINKYYNILNNYDRFIFLNQTLIGPFFPVWCKNQDWISVFNSMIDDDCKLSGISINYHPIPHVQSTIFCTDYIGLILLIKNNIFKNNYFLSKQETIYTKEIGISFAILNNGYNIKSLLKLDNGIYFRKNPKPLHLDVWWHNYYMGKTPHPYETIFIKTNTNKRISFNEIIELHKGYSL
jgi:hypothetical protein